MIRQSLSPPPHPLAYHFCFTPVQSVAKLQRELLEVQRIFVDLQAMVEDQGHAITTIEAHVSFE